MAVASAGPYASLHLAPDRQPRHHPTTRFLHAGCPSCRPTNSVKALKATYLHKICPAVQHCTWNFSEAGHGKGPMDGVGGLLKRTADEYVARGNDIPSVDVFVSHLNISCPGVELTAVLPEEVQKMEQFLPKKVSSVPGNNTINTITAFHFIFKILSACQLSNSNSRVGFNVPKNT